MSARSNSAMSFQRHAGVFLLCGWLATSAAAVEVFSASAEHTIPTYISSTTTKTSSTKTATSSSTPTPSLAFEDLGNTTVCGEQNITWFYTGSYEYSLILAVTGSDIASDENDSTAVILQTYEGGLYPDMSFEWKTVDVPEGAYTVQITLDQADLTFASETFYVLPSDNESCLSSSTMGSAPGTSSAAGTATSATGSSSGGSTSVPALGAVSTTKISNGGIAGVVIGSLALVVGLLAALWLLRRCCRRSNGGAPRGGLFEKRRPKGAVSISSRTGSFSTDHEQTPGASDQSGGGAAVYTLNDNGSGYSGEKRQQGVLASGFGILKPKATHRSPYEHRSSFGSFGSNSTGVTSPSQGQHRPSASRHSSLMVGTDPFSSTPPSRRQSQDQVPVALYSPTSPFSSSPTPRSFSFPQDVSSTSSVAPNLGRIDTEPLSPPANAVIAQTISGREPLPPLSPTSSPSSQHHSLAAPRRKSGPSRKPVPTYSPSISNEEMELTEPTSPRSYSAGMGSGSNRSSSGQNSFAGSSLAGVSSVGSGHDWSSAAAHSHSAASGSGVGAGVSPASSRSFLPHPTHASSSISDYSAFKNLPQLNHKSSFGERQMHVLIPDPPSKEMQ